MGKTPHSASAECRPIICPVMKDHTILQTGESVCAPFQGLMKPPQRILVVDEDSDLRHLYAAVLVRPGYHVDAAEDGDAGWQALHASRYDLLITDHDVPKVSGVELVRKLRAARMAVPVIMAARRLPVEELVRDPSLRLAAMLPKPFSIDTLLETVRVVLRVTDSPPGQTVAPPSWRSQPSAEILPV
jgi:DNA-binding response OmpR family regulator